MDKPKHYWFPAKRYGWGWGLPLTWQGWLVYAVFVVLLVVGAAALLPRLRAVAFVVYASVLCLVLMLVCYRTGEPPKWRWGAREDA